MKVYHKDILGELIATDEVVTFHEINDPYGPNQLIIRNPKIKIGSSVADDSGINVTGYVKVKDKPYYQSVCYNFFPINK